MEEKERQAHDHASKKEATPAGVAVVNIRSH
jgi:hypothetical protein